MKDECASCRVDEGCVIQAIASRGVGIECYARIGEMDIRDVAIIDLAAQNRAERDFKRSGARLVYVRAETLARRGPVIRHLLSLRSVDRRQACSHDQNKLF